MTVMIANLKQTNGGNIFIRSVYLCGNRMIPPPSPQTHARTPHHLCLSGWLALSLLLPGNAADDSVLIYEDSGPAVHKEVRRSCQLNEISYKLENGRGIKRVFVWPSQQWTLTKRVIIKKYNVDIRASSEFWSGWEMNAQSGDDTRVSLWNATQ